MKNYTFLLGLAFVALFALTSYSQECPAPQNLTISNIEANSATVSWQIQEFLPEGEDVIISYSLALRQSLGDWNWYELNILPFESSINIEGLAASSSYEVRMLSECDSGSSVFSDTLYFTTASEFILGCTDSTACNYNPNAIQTDSSCIFPSFEEDIVTACDSFEWIDGITYTESTFSPYPTFFIENTDGSCLTKSLNLSFNNPSESSEDTTVCYSYDWQGATYSQTGSYIDTITNSAGCDSIITLNLTVLNSSSFSQDVTACDSFEWNGETYSFSGLYIHIATSSFGCDSIVFLNLTINKSTASSLDTSVCDSYEWNGEVYTESGTYTYTSENSVGCDSVETLNLTILNSASFQDTIVCDSYEWNSQVYTESGTYTYTTSNSFGCDSVATLNLTINTSSTSTQEITVCGSYEWNGEIYTESGTYTYSTTNGLACDSIATLILSTDVEIYSTQDVTICDSYEWNDSIYTQSGVYEFETISSGGCDSIATLNLTILLSIDTTLFVTSCSTYEWNDTVYVESGIYTETFVNTNGCDSMVTLNLTLYPLSETSIDTTFCEGESITVGSSVYSSSGVYSDTLVNVNGCDSVVLSTIIVSSFESLNIDGDETVEVNQTLTYSVPNTIGSTYNWNISAGATIISGNGMNQISIEFLSAGQTIISVVETNDIACSSNVVTLLVMVEEAVLINNFKRDFGLQVYPNPFSSQAMITFNNPNSHSFRLEIMDLRGRIVRQFDNITTDRMLLKKDLLNSGLYHLNLIGSDGAVNRRIMIE